VEKEFVSPNLHVVLLHFPLALLVCGTFIELFAFLWRKSSFHVAGRWMILLGALCGIPTALSGAYALKDVARMNATAAHGNTTWNELVKASPLGDEQWEMLRDHLQLELAAVILAVLVAISWLAFSDRWRTRMQVPYVIVLLISVGLAAAGAWHGGEAVYAYGVGVSVNQSAAHALETHELATTGPTTEFATSSPATTSSMENSLAKIQHEVDVFVPPVQMHVILAGTTVAIALAALGLSIRKITQPLPPPQVDHIAAALGSPESVLSGETQDPMVEHPELAGVRLPCGRFWMLAFVAALLTAVVGDYMLAASAHTWSLNDLWNGFIKDHIRRAAHVITGGSLVLLPLILAALARWAPRQKWLLTIFVLLLLVAVGFQVWVGILLLFDTHLGPLSGFN
jgi:uncharacterized membrane protein